MEAKVKGNQKKDSTFMPLADHIAHYLDSQADSTRNSYDPSFPIDQIASGIEAVANTADPNNLRIETWALLTYLAKHHSWGIDDAVFIAVHAALRAR